MTHSCVIVGLGQIGMGYDLHLDAHRFVQTHARAFTVHPAFELAGAVDPDPEKREQFETRYGRPAFAGLEPALEALRPAVGVVAVPTELHLQEVARLVECPALEAILCEKPLSYDAGDARRIAALCESRAVALYVNYMRRSDPGAIEIKRRLDAGEIRHPLKGLVWYSKGFLHNGSHFFNLMQGWLGRMLEYRVLDRGREREGTDRDLDVRVVFERGAVVFAAVSEEAYSHYTVELVCPNGRLRYERGGLAIEWTVPRPDPVFEGYRALVDEAEKLDSGMNRSQWHVADQLACSLAGQSAHLCTGREALETAEQMNRIIQHEHRDP